jgi:transglutaminase-like putative cysteine protease
MRIRAGYELVYDCPQPTPMLLCLTVHPSRQPDLVAPQTLSFSPFVEARDYVDAFGNICTRIVAPAGRTRISTLFEIEDGGRPDEADWNARQHPVEELPDDVLVYLLGSRYCDTDRLGDFAWSRFGNTPPGRARVQAVCDFVHDHIRFDYQRADSTRTASMALEGGVGVCRDFAHLAVAFCRALNIPTRYCTGYISDIGTPKPWSSMDFAAWMEVYLGGRWHAFDPRNNAPRIGRTLIACGRDAADVPLTHIFGPGILSGFRVWTDEVVE